MLSFNKELNKLTRAKRITSLLPQKVKFRIAKAIYDYQSDNIHGIDLVVPLQDDGLVCFINSKDLIGWKIFFFGEYEAGTNKILTEYIRKDSIVIEAGANMGSESLLISRIAKDGHVYCFEPNPYTFERLKINVSINELQNVSAYDIALGESDGQIQFNIFPKGFCNPGMSSKYMETSESKKITVAQKKLDTFISENKIGKVDFIKMDIQGAEMDMIVGAHETISRFHPIIFTEAFANFNDTGELYSKLTGYGYNLFLVEESTIKPMASVAEVKDGNWLAIYKGKI